MGPKVEAACRFAEHGGRAVITSLHRIADAVAGTAGTIVTEGVGMPDPIEVRKVPLHSVTDASELTKLIDDGVIEADRVIAVIGKTEGNGGVNDYTRIIADRAFREVLVAKGTRSADEVEAGADRVVRRHRRRDQPARDDLRDRCPPTRPRRRDEPRLTVGLRDERGAAARGHRPHRDGHQGRRRGEGGDGARRHRRTPPTCTTSRPRRRCSRSTRSATRRAAATTCSPRTRLTSMDVSNGGTALGVAVGARRDRHAARRGRPARPVAVLVGRVVLVRRRARSGAGRRRRQRARCRRPLPHRAQRHDRRARPGRHLGRRSAPPASSCPSARTRPICTAGW